MLNIDNVVRELTAERDRINAALAALGNAPKRRGRPPKSVSVNVWRAVPADDSVAVIDNLMKNAVRLSGRKGPRSASARKLQSARMKAYWAKRRKQKAAA